MYTGLIDEDEPVPWEYTRWQLAKAYGWTLEYIDSLSIGDIREWYQVTDATAKYGKSEFAKLKDGD